jgi:hypothetical protein
MSREDSVIELYASIRDELHLTPEEDYHFSALVNSALHSSRDVAVDFVREGLAAMSHLPNLQKAVSKFQREVDSLPDQPVGEDVPEIAL